MEHVSVQADEGQRCTQCLVPEPQGSTKVADMSGDDGCAWNMIHPLRHVAEIREGTADLRIGLEFSTKRTNATHYAVQVGGAAGPTRVSRLMLWRLQSQRLCWIIQRAEMKRLCPSH